MKNILVGMRKFLMATIFLLISTTLLLFGIVPADTWMKHMAEVMVAFMATNIGEHIISIGKQWIEERGKKDIREVMNNVIPK